MICPNCQINKAQQDPKFGILPCKPCQKKHAKYSQPGRQIEFTTEFIKTQRKEFADDIEQPHYKGALNKKWVDIYGAEEAKKKGFTEQEIKNAKYTYDGTGIRYYNDGQ